MAIYVFSRRTTTPPTGGVTVRTPFAQGLAAAFAPGLGMGLTDLVSGLQLTLSSTVPTLGVAAGTSGLVCNAVAAHAWNPVPEWLKLPLPIFLICRIAFIQTPSTSATFFGVRHNTTVTAPYECYSLGVSGAGRLRCTYNSAGTFAEYAPVTSSYGTAASYVGTAITVAALFDVGGPSFYLGPDVGVFNPVATSNPVYGTGSRLIIGDYVSSPAINPAVVFEWGLIYRRRLVQNEIALFRTDPYHWIGEAPPNRAFVGFGPPAAWLLKVTQFIREVAYGEDEDPPPPVTPCEGGGEVIAGTNPGPGADLTTATVPLVWMEIFLTGGTVQRWAKATIPHGAPKMGRVITFGSLTRRLTDGDGGPQASTITTTLADTDRALRLAAFAGTLHYALVEYYCADLATLRAGGTPQRIFRGRVQSWTAEANLTLTLTVQDELTARLTSANAQDAQSPIRIIDRSIHDFQPLASLYGQAAPEIYGELSDTHIDPPIGQCGTWEPRHVADQTIDPGPFASLGQLSIFLVCSGAVSQIQTVYLADPGENPPVSRVPVPASAYGDWVFAPGIAWFSEAPEEQYWVDTAGRRWTVIAGLASHPVIRLAVENRVPMVVNLCGYEEVGDSTGRVINRPARGMLHWLNNRVVQDSALDWEAIFTFGGDYSLFDTATFASVDALCEARGYRVAGVIGHDFTARSWRERVAEWCLNFGFEIGTNRHGQVILVMLNRGSAFTSAPRFTPAVMLQEGCRVTMSADSVENVIRYVFARNYVSSLQGESPPDGSRARREPFDAEWQSDRLELTDEASITALGGHPRGERRARVQEYGLIRDADTADQVAAERLALHCPPNGRAEVGFDLLLKDGWSLELGDVIRLEHWDVPWSGSRRCQVRTLTLDLDALTISPTVRDVEDLLS